MVHPGLLSCLVHDLWLRVGDARHSHQVCGWQPIGRCSWSTQETGCHREEPIQPRGGGWQHPHKTHKDKKCSHEPGVGWLRPSVLTGHTDWGAALLQMATSVWASSVLWQQTRPMASWCIYRHTSSSLREKFIQFYSTLTRLYLRILCPGLGAPQCRIIFWENGACSAWKRGDLSVSFSYLWWGYQEDWGRLFCWGVELEVDSLSKRGDILT